MSPRVVFRINVSIYFLIYIYVYKCFIYSNIFYFSYNYFSISYKVLFSFYLNCHNNKFLIKYINILGFIHILYLINYSIRYIYIFLLSLYHKHIFIDIRVKIYGYKSKIIIDIINRLIK